MDRLAIHHLESDEETKRLAQLMAESARTILLSEFLAREHVNRRH